MSDLKDFLESIRKHSDKIGETAMKQVGLGFMIGWPVAYQYWVKHRFLFAKYLVVSYHFREVLHIYGNTWLKMFSFFLTEQWTIVFFCSVDVQ